jgi:hypothetical protein
LGYNDVGTDGILAVIQAEAEKFGRYLEDRRSALLRELAGVERALGIKPTTKELREMWHRGGLKGDD